MIELKKILEQVDFSSRSIDSLHYALSLARTYSASLLLLHVVDMGAAESIFRIHTTGPEEMMAEKLCKYCEKQFDKMLVDLDTSGVNIDRRVVQGHAHLEIVRAAALEDIDAVVMCTHGYKGLEHMLHGSVTEKVVRSAPCPVLAIKSSGYKFRLPGKTKAIRKEDVSTP